MRKDLIRLIYKIVLYILKDELKDINKRLDSIESTMDIRPKMNEYKTPKPKSTSYSNILASDSEGNILDKLRSTQLTAIENDGPYAGLESDVIEESTIGRDLPPVDLRNTDDPIIKIFNKDFSAVLDKAENFAKGVR